MKKAIIAVVLVLLLGSAAGGYFMFVHGNDPKLSAAADPMFFKLEPFVVPLMRGGAVEGYTRVEVTLEVPDLHARIAVERHMPRLRNAILADLVVVLSLRRRGLADAQDLGFIKGRIKAIAVKQYGSALIRDVLIEDVMERPSTAAPPS